MKKKPPTLEDVIAAGRARTEAAGLLAERIEECTEVVVGALRAGFRPTEVARAAQWTAAHVRKIARDHGIEADERYADRAERIRRAQSA